MVLAAVLSMLRYVSFTDDRDFVDRLHSYFTCNILIGLSILVSFKQFGGKPIECLVPDIFSSSWEQYAENYCWSQDTYFVPLETHVTTLDSTDKKQLKISYYQWIPFFLLIEAAFFRLPSLLWRYMGSHSGLVCIFAWLFLGIKIHEIVKLTSDPNNIKPEIKRANLKALSNHLQGALRFHRRLAKRQIRPHTLLKFFNLPYTPFFVTSVYIITKFFYLANVCLQLFLLNRYCMLVVFTLGSFLYWLFVAILPSMSKRFVMRHLEMSDMPFDANDEDELEKIEKFVDSYLRSDGVFVIRMITLQSGVIFGTELVGDLYRVFGGIEPQLKRAGSDTALALDKAAIEWTPPKTDSQGAKDHLRKFEPSPKAIISNAASLRSPEKMFYLNEPSDIKMVDTSAPTTSRPPSSLHMIDENSSI